MSAFSIKITPDHVIIASDTLVYRKHKGEPLVTCNYNSKTHYLPTFKACAVIVGHTHLAADFLSFIRLRVQEREARVMLNLVKDHFLDYIDESNYVYTGTEGVEPDELGLLDLVAYNEEISRFIHFKVWINRQGITIEEETCDLGADESLFICHPRISPELSEAITSQASSIEDMMIQHMKQMYVDSLSEQTQSVFLGGEIIITILSLKPRLHCLSYVAYEFPDLAIFHSEVKPQLVAHRGTEHFKDVEKAMSKHLDIKIGRNLATHRSSTEDRIEELERKIADVDQGCDDYYRLLGKLQAAMNLVAEIDEMIKTQEAKLNVLSDYEEAAETDKSVNNKEGE